MSGGSYNYLYLRSLREVIDSSEVAEMAQRLAQLGYHDVANETRLFLSETSWMLRFLEARRAAVENVWRAVERVDSSDDGQAELGAAIAGYRAARERATGEAG